MEKYHERKTARDYEYILAYKLCNSQVKAARLCGVGRETIARALRRANIPLTGRKRNGANNPQRKVTNAEIIECSKTMTCSEIAHKYGMSPENLYRRARKLGIMLNDNLSGGHWKRRSDFYGCGQFDESITLKEVIKRFGGVCQICGKPINEKAIANGHVKKDYPSLDHIQPLSKGGTHTWDNVQLAHIGCNSRKRDKVS